MGIRLWRVDERLLHGQVIVGWGKRLGLRWYLVVDEGLAESGWERELYDSALPGGVEAAYVAPAAAPGRLEEMSARSDAGAVLTRGTSAMRSLAEAGLLEGRRVNVGGLHAADGRRRVADYLYLSAEEADDLRAVAARAERVEARALPDSPSLSLEEMLDAADAG